MALTAPKQELVADITRRLRQPAVLTQILLILMGTSAGMAAVALAQQRGCPDDEDVDGGNTTWLTVTQILISLMSLGILLYSYTTVKSSRIKEARNALNDATEKATTTRASSQKTINAGKEFESQGLEGVKINFSGAKAEDLKASKVLAVAPLLHGQLGTMNTVRKRMMFVSAMATLVTMYVSMTSIILTQTETYCNSHIDQSEEATTAEFGNTVVLIPSFITFSLLVSVLYIWFRGKRVAANDILNLNADRIQVFLGDGRDFRGSSAGSTMLTLLVFVLGVAVSILGITRSDASASDASGVAPWLVAGVIPLVLGVGFFFIR